MPSKKETAKWSKSKAIYWFGHIASVYGWTEVSICFLQLCCCRSHPEKANTDKATMELDKTKQKFQCFG